MIENDDIKVPAFHLCLRGTALLSYRTLDEETNTTMTNTKEAFTARYDECSQWKMERTLFSTNQQTGESVDDFINKIQNTGIKGRSE